MRADYRPAIVGWMLIAAGCIGLMLVAAYPLGLIRDIYPEPPKEFVTGPFGMTEPIPSVESLHRRPGEPESVYFDRLTKSVAAGIVHFWYAGDEWDSSDAAYTAVSPWDNYLLWLLKDRHEFMDPSKAIERGYGFCSQVARIVYSILDDQGIPSKVLEHAEHVVVEADGQILDADYGVYIPHSAVWMQAHPEAVNAYYREFGWMIPLLTKIYASGEWKALTPGRWREPLYDRLKWLPPLVIIGAGVWLAFGFPTRSPQRWLRRPAAATG